ncbi:hypothetical protein L6164_026411 [Bauhinia variegata]|uniref:Uncharacterized protein n=1 Tax=Bauhinia variegata TaxID=167791 RepID=A0ACB9LPN8_BAUVA|nr:hypothetical protein L6164_026411 [Bauhinia variegata]
MTSRSREVLFDQMNTHVNILLEVLPRVEAWKLFKDKAQFDESAVSGEFLSIAAQVVEECAGLPVAIVTVASALRNKSLLEWKDALRQLQNPSLTNTSGIYNLEEARNSLYTCIRKLKDSYLLLDGYSPKRFNMHDVVQDVAIFLASAEHHFFIKRYARLEEWPERDQLTSCKTIILNRSDIDELPKGLDGPNLTFFHLNNKKPFLDIADDFFKGMSELKVLNLAGETLDSLPSSINLLCNLRALCLNLYVLGDLGIIGELKGLKVLTLSSEMTQLPPELCQLNQLQLLDLRGCCNLVLIPPNLLSSLTKLQELYLATHIYSSSIQWHVNDPNYKQKSMKHCGKEVFDGASDPNNQESKASLGELNNLARLTTLETRIFDEKMLPKDLVFERLRSYKIIIGSEPNLSSEYETSRMLKLDLNTSIHSWHNVKRLLDSVEDLHLYHLKGAENVVPGTNEGGMLQLKYLHLHFSDEIQTIVDLSRWNLVDDIFPNMESLVIDYCTNLEEICNGSLTGGSFSRLKVIKVANCVKMKSLFSVSSFRGRPHCNMLEETNENAESMLQFTELQSLMLIGMPELISFWLEDKRDCSAQGKQLLSTDVDGEMVTEDNIPHTPITLFNNKVMLPNLEEMIISYVVKLNTIWHWQQRLCPKSFDKLRKLEIENCRKLVIIFPSHIGSSINSLETLLITNCESLEHVFEETHSEISGVPASVLCFPNLQQVHVQRCERLKYLFPASVANTLGKLQRLKIENCSKIEEIVIKEDNASPSSEVIFDHGGVNDGETLGVENEKQARGTYSFPNLLTLHVEGLERTKYLFPASMGKSFGKLQKLLIRKCPMIEKIVIVEDNAGPLVEEVMLPNLEEMIIVDLVKLKMIFNCQQKLTSDTFGRLKKFEIKNCPELLSLLPYHIMSRARSLETLTIVDCKSLEQIFSYQGANARDAHGRTADLPGVVNDKHLRGMLSFPHLLAMHVEGCASLKYLFPEFVAKSLVKLQKLLIEKCSLMEEVIMVEENTNPLSKEVMFPELEEMIIIDMDQLKAIWHWQQALIANSFGKLKKIETRNCPELLFPSQILSTTLILETLIINNCKYLQQISGDTIPETSSSQIHVSTYEEKIFLFSAPVAKNLEKLQNLEVRKCSIVEEIITDGDNTVIKPPPSGEKVLFLNLEKIIIVDVDKLNTIWDYQQPLPSNSFSKLGKIEIRNCPELTSIFQCNTMSAIQRLETHGGTVHQTKEKFSFPNLQVMCVEGCERLKYLFPPFTGEAFVRLEDIVIEKCSMMEEIILVEKNIHCCFSEEVRELWESPDLQGSFCNLTTLRIANCEGLLKVLPFNVMKSLINLEELKIQNCYSAEAVFDLEGIDIEETNVIIETWLRKLTLDNLHNLKHVWNKDQQDVLSFRNLEVVSVRGCGRLTYLFPTNIAKDLTALEVLIIDDCGFEEIVAKRKAQAKSLTFMFSKLTYLKIWKVPKLKRFYPGDCTIKWPKLKTLTVHVQTKVKVFGTKKLKTSKMHRLYVPIQQPIFLVEKVFPNLEELSITNMVSFMRWHHQFPTVHFERLKVLGLCHFNAEQASIPYWILQRIPNLEYLHLAWNSFKEVFPHDRYAQGGNDFVHLKRLFLVGLPKLEHIYKEGLNLHKYIMDLQYLLVKECCGLKELVPSSASFNHLGYLEVCNCHGLLHLVTSSTAKSLVQLTALKIRQCLMITEIVLKEENGDGDHEITFSNLKVLELKQLSSLRNFSSGNYIFKFPLLESVIVTCCPYLKTFSQEVPSTPHLQSVRIEDYGNALYWEGNLNATIQKMYHDMLWLHGFELSKLNEFPKLKELWLGHVPREFKYLTSLVVDGCEFVSDVIPFNVLKSLINLEELIVRSCNSVEAVFDLEGINFEETNVMLETRLKKLTLNSLPNLYQVWRNDPQGIVSFENLQVVSARGCERLTSLFPENIAKGLTQLEELAIDGCGVEEIVAKEEGQTMPLCFVFPILTILRISNVPKIKCFYSGDYTAEWPRLKELFVHIDSEVNVFGTKLWKKHEDHHLEIPTEQPILLVEKVFQNLEQLTINKRVSIMDSPHQFPMAHCQRLKVLSLHYFNAEQDSIPCWILQRVPKLEDLGLMHSSFKQVFPCEGYVEGADSFVLLKRLKLLDLPKLEYIYKEGLNLHKYIMELQYLWVEECCGLKELVPSSASFKNLGYLQVWKCDDLLHLVTSSTARSFVQLTTLIVRECNMIAEIVTKEENEDGDHGITFRKLKFLELHQLSSLRNFSSGNFIFKFPSLVHVTVTHCPNLKTFSQEVPRTPHLQRVRIEDYGNALYWEGNLNATIQKMYSDMVGLHSFELSKLNEFPKLKELWLGHVPRGFKYLTSLVVDGCEFVSDVIPFNVLKSLINLEELIVRSCNSVEAVFDLEGINFEETNVMLETRLKNLTLNSLPNLNQVWRNDPQGIVSFENLQVVSARGCERLTSLFPANIAKVLTQLEELVIDGCGVEEIVAKEEGQTMPLSFVFPKLTIFNISNVPKLKCFYSGDYTAEWPRLKELFVHTDSEVNVFGTKLWKKNEDHHLGIPTERPILLVEKVFQNLERLSINNIVSSMDSPPQFSMEHFQRLKVLWLHFFRAEQDSIPCWILQRIPKLEDLGLLRCSFKQLSSLRSFSTGNFAFKFPSLEDLTVSGCTNLETFSKVIPDTPSLQKVQVRDEGNGSHWQGNLNKIIPKIYMQRHVYM